MGFFVSFAALVLAFIAGVWETTKAASTGVGRIVGYWRPTIEALPSRQGRSATSSYTKTGTNY